MKLVIQKCLNASVSVNGKRISKIGKGLVVLASFTHTDTGKEVDFMVNKTVNLRIFEDENGVMNKSVKDENGEILCISQFTLYGDASKRNRPSYIMAMKGEQSVLLYNSFCKKLGEIVPTKTGVFGADMKVELVNDGPTTIIIEK